MTPQEAREMLDAYVAAIEADDTETEVRCEKTVLRERTQLGAILHMSILGRQTLYGAMRSAKEMGDEFEPTTVTRIAELVIATSDHMLATLGQAEAA